MKVRIKMIELLTLIGLLGTMGLTACQPVAGDLNTPATETPAPTAEENPLLDTTWYLIGYGREGALTSPVAGSEVTISFAEGTLSGTAGCNRYFADYELTGTALSIQSIGSTEMWCEGLMEQETSFLQLLPQAQHIQLDEQLVIEAGEEQLVFAPNPPVPAVSLEGTVWILTAIGTAETVQSPLANTRVTLEFAQGQASGESGCNYFGMEYAVDGDSIEFGPAAVTLQACEEQIMAQEAQVMEILGAAASFELEGDQLTIHGQDQSLHFAAAENLALEAVIWVLAGIAQDDAVVSTWLDEEITAVFENGQVAGFAGCNQYSAEYQLDDDLGLTVGPIISTRMACEGERNQREGEFLAALEAVASYQIKMNVLTLLDDAGRSIASFKAQD